jgi:hypothetical protein
MRSKVQSVLQQPAIFLWLLSFDRSKESNEKKYVNELFQKRAMSNFQKAKVRMLNEKTSGGKHQA